MDTSLKLQLDIKNNAQELKNYMLDLSNWEEEMKRKEIALNNEKPQEKIIPPPRNKIKRSKLENVEKTSNKNKKISGYDYSAWDKFDVEKACAEIDEEDDENKESEGGESQEEEEKEEQNQSDVSKNDKNLSLIDEAFYEKEMGNNFVKKEQWNEAIKCYTNAINLDSRNAIYYANRSLCFLKLKNFKSAETDATTALQLDKNYIKAYQRRAIARLALGQLTEAKADYEEILKLEPKNSLAKLEIDKINEKLTKGQPVVKKIEKKTFNPKNMFKSDNRPVESSKEKPTTSKSIAATKEKPPTDKKPSVSVSEKTPRKTESSKVEVKTEIKKVVPVKKENKNLERGDGVEINPTKPKPEVFNPLPDWCKVIRPVNIPPHKRSKKPFKRIDIKLMDKDEDLDVVVEENTKCEKVPEKKEEQTIIKSHENDKFEDEAFKRVLIESENVPKTAIQFLNSFKVLKKDPEKCYSYLKKIPGKDLPQIFGDSLESNFFSELITFLAGDEIKKDSQVIYDFLLGLSNVKRFSSLTLFMSGKDRKCVEKCIEQLKEVKSEEEILELYKLYELKH